jgi:hypothetical protein
MTYMEELVRQKVLDHCKLLSVQEEMDVLQSELDISKFYWKWKRTQRRKMTTIWNAITYTTSHMG